MPTTNETIPAGMKDQITFITGVDENGLIANRTFWRWNYAIPAGYQNNAKTGKWGTPIAGTGASINYWFDPSGQFTATEQQLFAATLAMWSAVANVTFNPVSSQSSAQLVIRPWNVSGAYQGVSTGSGASSGVGSSALNQFTSGTISVDAQNHPTSPLNPGTWWYVLEHEIGHVLGLGHSGPYDGNSINTMSQQFGPYDCELWTVMSYVRPEYVAAYAPQYSPSGTDWQGQNPTTPMPVDILAIQRLYGKPTSTPLSGGQVFGFHSNITGAIAPVYDFTKNTRPIVTLWDMGGGNTLDLSGFTTTESVSLVAGTFSSVAGLTNNLAIAFETRIDTLICGAGDSTVVCNDNGDTVDGGLGNDRITGGTGNDSLRGGAGTNTLVGGAGTDTAVFAGRPGDYYVVSNGATTRVIGQTSQDTLSGIEQVSFDGAGTLTLAAFQAQSFQALRYIASYGDLIAAFGTNAEAGAQHYFNNGRAEGRTVTFNALTYIASYGDLIESFGDDQAKATEHFISQGFRAGRNATFSALNYIASYSDLIQAFGDDQTKATQHYINSGYREGRQTHFDPLNYIASYSDLIKAFGNNPVAGAEHFINSGYREGRFAKFDAMSYIASYSDLIEAFGTDIIKAENHYIGSGYWEGRAITYDPVAYLISNPDLGDLGYTLGDVTLQYIAHGYKEGRQESGGFGLEQTNHILPMNYKTWDAVGISGDRDWFEVSLTAGQTYTFRLSGADGGNGTLADPFLSLYDAHGHLAASNNASGGQDSIITFTATATGNFYVVAAAGDAGTGTFTLFGAVGG